MVGSLTKALNQSRARDLTTHDTALRLRSSGVLDLAIGNTSNPFMSQLNGFTAQGSNKLKYSLFRGWVYSAINTLAVEAAGQPVCLGKLTGRPTDNSPINVGRETHFIKQKMTKTLRHKAALQELEIIPSHPLLDALDSPNQLQDKWQFVYSFFVNLALTGWSFVVGDTNDEGELEFFSLPTTWVKPIHKNGPFSQFKIVNPNNPASESEAKVLDRSQVAFSYFPNPSDPMKALAPAQAILSAIEIDDHIQSSQNVFFENGVFPSMLITIGKNPHPDVPAGIRPRLSPAQRRQVYGAIKKVSGGVSNYGNPAIVDGMVEKFERLSATQNEMGWEKSEQVVKGRILSAFGVHPFMLGEQMNGSYAQAYVVKDIFCSRVNTYLDLLSNMMTSFIIPLAKEDDSFLIWWEECAPSDPSLEQRWWLEARKNNDISQDELRAKMGLPPDRDRNESVIGRQSIQAVTKIAEQVQAGILTPEQGQAILTGMGLPTDMANMIAGQGSGGDPALAAIERVESAISTLSSSLSRRTNALAK